MAEYHKTMVELINFGRNYDGYYIQPTRIDADGRNCVITFNVIDSDNKREVVLRRGRYYDDVFSTKIHNIPFTINLRTNVIKRIKAVPISEIKSKYGHSLKLKGSDQSKINQVIKKNKEE